MTQGTEVADFFSNWSIYRAVIENNCMEHQQIFQTVHSMLARRTAPFTLLDLGCGDAAAIGPAMVGTQVQRYVGVDCAGPALQFARQTLIDSPVQVDLRIGDLMETILQSDESFDVILISFALHHFSAAEKRRFLVAARDRLAPGGEVILIDVVRRDGETREQYLDRYEGNVASWPVGEDRRDQIMVHVRASDYPEEISRQEAWARAAGYAQVEQFYLGGQDTQSGWRLGL